MMGKLQLGSLLHPQQQWEHFSGEAVGILDLSPGFWLLVDLHVVVVVVVVAATAVDGRE